MFDVRRSEAYGKRLEHRKTCRMWAEMKDCVDCGFDLVRFGEELIKEAGVDRLQADLDSALDTVKELQEQMRVDGSGLDNLKAASDKWGRLYEQERNRRVTADAQVAELKRYLKLAEKLIAENERTIDWAKKEWTAEEKQSAELKKQRDIAREWAIEQNRNWNKTYKMLEDARLKIEELEGDHEVGISWKQQFEAAQKHLKSHHRIEFGTDECQLVQYAERHEEEHVGDENG